MNQNYSYGQRRYEYRNKKIKMRRRMIALAIAASLGVGGFALSKALSSSNAGKEIIQPIETRFPTLPPRVEETPMIVEKVEEIVPLETPSPEPIMVQDGFHRGDSVVATTDVNLRLNTTKESFKMGVLPKGSVVDRILTDGDWDLIRYGSQIAYVHTDYMKENDIDYNQEYYHVEDYRDIVHTTSKVYFRLGPSINENDICLLDKDEELVVIGKSTSLTNPNDIWYLVRARGQIGFVKAEYTTSLRNTIMSLDPAIQDVQIQKMGYLDENTSILDANGHSRGTGEAYQLVQVLEVRGDYSLVNIDGVIGYVPKSSIKSIKGNFITVDISSQRICYYVDNDLAFQGKCTTGKKSSPTEIGMFTPYGKSSSHDFGHDNLVAKILWMPFNGGQGLHDASWESNSKFGDYSYTKKHGSAGCVRLPNDVATFVYDNVSKNTPVLVKK